MVNISPTLSTNCRKGSSQFESINLDFKELP